MRFLATVAVKLKNSVVILAISSVTCPVVSIVILKLIVNRVSGPARAVHIRRIKDNAVELAVLIRKITAVNTVLEIRGF